MVYGVKPSVSVNTWTFNPENPLIDRDKFPADRLGCAPYFKNRHSPQLKNIRRVNQEFQFDFGCHGSKCLNVYFHERTSCNKVACSRAPH